MLDFLALLPPSFLFTTQSVAWPRNSAATRLPKAAKGLHVRTCPEYYLVCFCRNAVLFEETVRVRSVLSWKAASNVDS